MCINLFTIKAKTYKKDSSFDAIDNIFLLVLLCLNQIWQCQGARDVFISSFSLCSLSDDK